MLDYIILLVLAAAFVLVAPVLGTIAFFRVRRLQKQVDDLEEQLTAAAPGPWQTASDASMASAAPTDVKIEPENLPGGEVVENNEQPQPDEHTEAARSDMPETAGQPASGGAESDRAVENGIDEADRGGNLEETVGAKWAVWVGGLALALGGVFLVRYSIEQGLLGPGTRIFLGALFSLTLALVGEWTRRRGDSYSVGGFESANIPAILTAAGTLGGFATIYAAYQLYGFLGPATAFVGLGVVAVVTMAAALLHGPLLAALGIAASFLVPFLVSSQEPSAVGLAVYALAVSVAAFGVGRLRLWR